MEKIALLFPGQGSQYVGMSKSLYEQYSVVRHTFAEASDALGYDLAALVFEGSLLDLSKIENALPALLTSSVSQFRVYMQEVGITPQFLAGHSLGEYSALTCAGAIPFDTAVKIVKKRAELARDIAETGEGAMTILSEVSVFEIEELCKKVSNHQQVVTVSCYNSSNEVAISGVLEAVQSIEDAALDAGAQVAPLMGTAPFHSILMQSAADVLHDELKQHAYRPIKWPVVSNVTASIYEGADRIVDLLTSQILMPVRWQETLAYLKRQGVNMTIEMGAKNVLSNLVKLETGLRALSFDHKEDRQELIESFAVRPEYRKHKPTVVTKAMAIAVATPNSNFEHDSYVKGVVEPYKALKSLQNDLDRSGVAPDVDQMKQALELLRIILTNKGISAVEQQEWYDQIFDETGTHDLFLEFASKRLVQQY